MLRNRVASAVLSVVFLGLWTLPAAAATVPGTGGGPWVPQPGVNYAPGIGGPVFCPVPGVNYAPGIGTSPKPSDYCEDRTPASPRHHRHHRHG